MYADRHARPEGIKPGSLAIAIGINGALVGALMFASPAVQKIKERVLQTTNVVEPVPPPPEVVPEIKPRTDAKQAQQPERVLTTIPLVPTRSDGYVLPPLPILPPPPPLNPGDFTRIDPPAQPPVLVDARLDPRYAHDLQPQYPAGERRAEREGFATVRVTIGSDGRVTGAECVAATSDAFCSVTVAQALAKWRFQPATRDGAAVGASKVMTVRFKLEM